MLGRSTMMESPLRVGIIGIGKHGIRYAKHIYEDLPEIDLVGLWRRDADEGKRQARQYRCRYFSTYSDLLSDNSIDAVVVALPPALNVSVCEEAAYRGKHILLEKPMAINVREAIRIHQTVSRSGVRLMVAQTLRFNAVVMALKARIPQLGSLHSIHLSQRFEPSTLAWLDQRDLAGGGIVLHTGVHSFDLLRFLAQGDAEEVSCKINRVVTRNTEDNFSAIMTFKKSQIIASVMGSRGTKGRNGSIEVAGENGQLIADHVHNYLYEIRGMERRSIELRKPVPTVYETLKAFYYSLSQEVPFPVTIDDGLIAVAMTEACYRSAETGKWEKVYYP
ncbi:MAG: Gfo/Idh/MocA family oxidoreductase [Syntrophobacterales bacterium]|nr:MAG: Gfo/Idh/MocA family oxidoreductase [Syntrophobacterales bacterium]